MKKALVAVLAVLVFATAVQATVSSRVENPSEHFRDFLQRSPGYTWVYNVNEAFYRTIVVTGDEEDIDIGGGDYAHFVYFVHWIERNGRKTENQLGAFVFMEDGTIYVTWRALEVKVAFESGSENAYFLFLLRCMIIYAGPELVALVDQEEVPITHHNVDWVGYKVFHNMINSCGWKQTTWFTPVGIIKMVLYSEDDGDWFTFDLVKAYQRD